jgi:hypothetical protein
MQTRRGTGCGHERVPERFAAGFLGGSLSGQQRSKRKNSRIPKGDVYLKTALVEAAHAAATVKGTYLRDKFYRRGYKSAAVAIAHKILVSIYHMLSDNASYNDLEVQQEPPHTQPGPSAGTFRLFSDFDLQQQAA